MPIGLNTRIVRNENQMSAPADNEIVILNMAKNNYISLDEIGRFIRDLLAEPSHCNDLILKYYTLSWRICRAHDDS